MGLDWVAEVLGLLAFLALSLLPGLAVVKAPWPSVPFLSLGFWLVSAWFLPASVSRSGFVRAALLSFALLAALRLLKPLPPLRPSRSTVVMLAALGVGLVPVPRPLDRDLGLAATEALLLEWRDGWPRTYEPLAPIPHFGAHAPGLPLLAADVAQVSGLAAHRAVRLVAAAGGGLLGLALFGLFDRLNRPRPGRLAGAAAGLVLGLAATLPPATVPLGLGPGPVVLAAAFGLCAVGLLLRGSGRAPAVASGLMLAAAFTVEAAVATVAFILLARRGDPRRRLWAMGLALALAVPRLAHLRHGRPGELGLALGEAWSRPRAVADERPSPASVAAVSAWLRSETDPLARVCLAPDVERVWGSRLPSLAHRAVEPPVVPAVYREESRAARRSPCKYALVTSGAAGAPGAEASPTLYESGGLRVFALATPWPSITSFDNVPGNRGPARP